MKTSGTETTRTDAGDAIARVVLEIGQAARRAAATLAEATGEQRTTALRAMARRLRAAAGTVLAANAEDVAAAQANGLSASLTDRLALDAKRVEAVASGLDAVASLPDPIGTELAAWDRPNGLNIARVRVPLGVIGIIYESRPNVTADAGGLCVRAGNAAILRGGSESFRSSRAIVAAMRQGLADAGLPEDAVQLIPTTDRAAVGHLLRMSDHVDVIVPRGGRSLIERVAAESRIPVIKHLDGICHVYVHGDADAGMARAIVVNAKMRRTSVCGSAETLLVDRAGADRLLAPLVAALIDAGCAVRGDAATQAADPRVTPASEADWETEYLDAIISVRVVDGVDGAVDHINRHGSHHTDSIVATDPAAAQRFLDRVDSAIVLWNASTQFADGGEFGMGAEIGISTGRLHARGPVGAEQLTTYKYVVRGTGQVRP